VNAAGDASTQLEPMPSVRIVRWEGPGSVSRPGVLQVDGSPAGVPVLGPARSASAALLLPGASAAAASAPGEAAGRARGLPAGEPPGDWTMLTTLSCVYRRLLGDMRPRLIICCSDSEPGPCCCAGAGWGEGVRSCEVLEPLLPPAPAAASAKLPALPALGEASGEAQLTCTWLNSEPLRKAGRGR
jgi:hypothetical protein